MQGVPAKELVKFLTKHVSQAVVILRKEFELAGPGAALTCLKSEANQLSILSAIFRDPPDTLALMRANFLDFISLMSKSYRNVSELLLKHSPDAANMARSYPAESLAFNSFDLASPSSASSLL